MCSMSIYIWIYVLLTYYAKLCDWSGRQPIDFIIYFNHKRTQKAQRLCVLCASLYESMCDYPAMQNYVIDQDDRIPIFLPQAPPFTRDKLRGCEFTFA